MGRFQRGDVIYVNLGYRDNRSVQQGERPCVVVSNNVNNVVSPVLLVCPCTSQMTKKQNPVHVILNRKDVKGFLPKKSIILVEQLISIDKRQIEKKMGTIENDKIMDKLNAALARQLALVDFGKEEQNGKERKDGSSNMGKAKSDDHGSCGVQ